ncbi:hypothetical protein QF038_001868 [Pseudarthrobacter sp. W1I19]|uniref:hypothetical protein n=1 Tax=Pseudarthrobacter sp. W1I19 TaxID=3042288 RepID=UPI00277E6F66|nr:hypothetical protein [Pseudarthrobacter sp. W1I19]MDQ0923360.1 hypothetical protein [Pseudarthrobacter sp. W1I19]
MPKSPAELEEAVMLKIAAHLQENWPNAVAHVDYGSGLKMTMRQAKRQKALNPRRGHPDLVIYEVRGSFIGLAVELKRDGVNIYKRDKTTPTTEHIAEQRDYLRLLSARGWYTAFAVGAPDCLQLIDDYLSGKLQPENDQD